MVSLSDDLVRMDAFIQGVVKKVTQFMANVLEDSKDRVLENLLPNDVDLVMYRRGFQWDMAKYPINNI